MYQEQENLRETSVLSFPGPDPGPGDAAVWIVDLHTGALECSEGVFHLYGQERDGSAGGAACFQALIHPEDLDLVMAAEERALNGAPSEISFRIIPHDCGMRYIFQSVSRIDTCGGKPVMVGVMQDRTPLRKAKDELAFYRLLAQKTGLLSGDMVAVTDMDAARIIHINPAMAQFMGCQAEKIQNIRMSLVHFIHPEDQRLLFNHMNEVLDFPEQVHEAAYRLKDQSGAYQAVRDRSIVLKYDEGNVPYQILSIIVPDHTGA